MHVSAKMSKHAPEKDTPHLLKHEALMQEALFSSHSMPPVPPSRFLGRDLRLQKLIDERNAISDFNPRRRLPVNSLMHSGT